MSDVFTEKEVMNAIKAVMQDSNNICKGNQKPNVTYMWAYLAAMNAVIDYKTNDMIDALTKNYMLKDNTEFNRDMMLKVKMKIYHYMIAYIKDNHMSVVWQESDTR